MTENKNTPKERIRKLTADLIAIPSVSSDHTQCAVAIDFVQGIFEKTGYIVERLEKSDVHSLILSKSGGRKFDLLFFGHLDVVPAKPELFNPVLRDGQIFGRGASDMKGAVAAMIRLFCDCEHESFLDSAALVLTTDEEVGGDNGIGYLTRECGLRARMVFNPDGGGVLSPALQQKGIYQFKLTASGRSAHGSRPWKGDSALLKLLEDIQTLLSLFTLATENDQENVSINIGKITGGVSANSVPEHAEALLDIRFPARHTLSSIRMEITGALKHSSITELTSGDPVSISEDNPAMELLTQILHERQHPRSFTKNNTGSDARWFSAQGSSILLMLPEGTNGHIDEEAVSVSGLFELYEIMKTLASRHYSLSSQTYICKGQTV